MPQEKFYGGNKIKAAVVDADQLVEGQARDIGDAKMSESKEDRDQGRIKKFLTRIWKHNLMDGYYRNKEIQKARKDIIENKNLYHGEAEIANQAQNTNSHKEAMDSIVERFTSEYENEMLRQEERDSREKAGAPLNAAIKDLIKKYAATPSMDKAAFEEEKNRLISTHNPKYANEKSLYADNLFDIANEVKQAVAEGEKLDQMDFEVNLTFGKARESLNTEGKKTTLDKLFGDNKFGKAVVQNAILAGAVAGAYSITKNLTMNYGKRAAKWFGFGAGLAAGAVVEGVKENARVNRERSQNMRENAKGMKFTDTDMERREEMAKNLYETKNATAIISELDGDLNLIKTGNVSEADMQAAFGRIAEIEARIRLGEAKKIDLISYDHYGSVEKDRMKIALRLAEIKVAIRKETAANPKAFMNGASYDDFIEGRTTHQENLFSRGDIAAKDKIFGQLKTRRIIRKMGQTMLMGAAAGFITQEVGALFTSRDGVIEGGAKSIYNHFSGESNHGADLHKNATALEALRRNLFGESPRMSTEHMHEAIMGATHIELPDGADIIDNGNGTYDFVRDGVVISNDIPLSFDSNGNLSPESIALLNKDDIYTDFYKIHDPEGKIDGNGAKNPSEWVEQHKDSMHRIHRHFMGNNTPMVDNPDYPGDPRHRFGSDLNELRADWGGVNNTGVTENGDYAFNVHRMTDDGSFQGDSSVAAHKQMLDGNLKMLLSVSKDSQQYVFEVDVDKYGNAIVDKNSEIGKMLFTTDASGHAVYTGAYAEIAHMNADVTYPDGGQDMDILATHIGDDAAHIPHDDVPYVKFDLPDDTDYDPPYPIPIVPRRPLERGEYGEAKKGDKDGKKFHKDDGDKRYLYLTGSVEDKKRWEKNMSPRLKNNPEAVLSQKEELDTYFKNQTKERGAEYIKELDSFVDKNEVLKNLRKETKVSVCMPVAAAQEYENIYKTLSLYSQQDKESKDKTLILMNVNWPDDADMVKVQKTLDEIERAKKDFPDLQIADFSKVWPRKWIKEKEGAIYGEVVKYLNDTALRAIQRSGIEKDIYLLTNDADAKGMSSNYLKTLINSADKNNSKDGFLGKIEWSPELYQKYPGYHLSMRMYQFLETSLRASSVKNRNVASSGANFMVKSSMFAAVGGYNAEMGAGADTDLGRAIKYARFGKNDTLSEDKYPIKYINGAWIDTDPSRSFRYYQEGKPIISQWADFDEGGYQPRGDLTLNPEDGEDVEKDFDKILSRSSYQMTSIVRDWIGFSKVDDYTKALNFAFPPQLDSSGKKIKLWNIGKDSDGNNEVQFTDAGKEWVKKQLVNYDSNNLSELIYKRGVKGVDDAKEIKKKSKAKSKAKVIKTREPKNENVKPETLSQKEFSKEIEKAFKAILSKEDKATIEKFSVNFEGDRIVGHTELKAKNSLGGKPVIDLDIMSDGKDFVFNKTGNKIRANNLARGSVNEAVAGIPDKIKEVLEKKYKQKINSISIEGGEIKLTFE